MAKEQLYYFQPVNSSRVRSEKLAKDINPYVSIDKKTGVMMIVEPTLRKLKIDSVRIGIKFYVDSSKRVIGFKFLDSKEIFDSSVRVIKIHSKEKYNYRTMYVSLKSLISAYDWSMGGKYVIHEYEDKDPNMNIGKVYFIKVDENKNDVKS